MSTALSMAFGAFVVGVSELMTAGISDVMATDLGVSVASVGSLIFWHAVAYAVAPPLLLSLRPRRERRTLLLVSAAIFTLASVAVAGAPGIGTALVGRVVQGGASGIVLAIAISCAGESVPGNQRGRAMATVLMGLSLALVAGVPLGVLIAEVSGWRSAFYGVAAGGAGLCGLLIAQPDLGQAGPHGRHEGGGHPQPMGRRQVAALVVSLAWMSAYSTMFSYAAPLLKHRFDLDGAGLSVAIVAFGTACMGGGYLGGALSDAISEHRAAILAIVLNALVIAAFPFLAGGLASAVTFMAAWGLSSWMVVAPVQAILASGEGSVDVALGLNNSGIQVGIGIGALIGGILHEQHPAHHASASLLLLLLALGACLAVPRMQARAAPMT
ncbi:MFS transporter [Methylobacterium nodulans]|uniref:Major facilitator superfamily MFS_1 n=1 Tax=Methylobacterium nodulans (strain LMG 21967 / CNCM I-2342 / ORS 2060) TaxID=460265 RepID=B8IWN3_METNO|nr:MFS transporter [Methylobacterium nodulans]ACL62924.1 major facilitator superfamily MFS_1 [Methylobacterium nodulans ORS 2060]